MQSDSRCHLCVLSQRLLWKSSLFIMIQSVILSNMLIYTVTLFFFLIETLEVPSLLWIQAFWLVWLVFTNNGAPTKSYYAINLVPNVFNFSIISVVAYLKLDNIYHFRINLGVQWLAAEETARGNLNCFFD